MPYTYLIECIPTNQYYYGVRFAKNCLPEELWVTYFTSSKYVKKLIKEHGIEQFKVKIRKLFLTSKDARKWEHKVLRRIKAKEREDFINMTDNMSIASSGLKWWTNGIKNTKSLECPGEGWYRGNCTVVKRSKESIEKQMRTRLLKYGSYATNKGIKHSQKTKEKISKSKTGIKLGRQTAEHIEKRKMFSIKNPMFGKTHSKEVKEKIALLNSKPKTIEHKQKISEALKLYHFNKIK
jgi:hypothetical protein